MDNKSIKKDYRGEKARRILQRIEQRTPACCYKTDKGEKVVVLLDYWSVPYDEEYWFWQCRRVTYLIKRRRSPRVLVTEELFTTSYHPEEIIRVMRGGLHWERYTVKEAVESLDYNG